MALEQNITLDDHWFKGADQQFRFTIVDSSGNAQTMTGWALEWVLRRLSPSSSTAVLTKNTSGGTIVISSGSGTDDRATVTVTDDDTLNIPAGTYHYAIRRTDAGNEQVLAFGTAELQAVATR